MSSANFLQNPASSWTNVYFNSVNAGSFSGNTGGTGTFDNVVVNQNLFTDSVYPRGTTGTTTFHSKLIFSDPTLGDDPNFSFRGQGTSGGTGSSIMYVGDFSSGFN